MIRKNSIKNILLILVGVILGFLCIIPVFITVIQSFLVDGVITIRGYIELFINCFLFYGYFWNSTLYTVVITIATLLISIPAAFAFRFSNFRGKKSLYILYIILMMMPLQVMILPNYIGLRDMNLLNTPMSIIIPAIFTPLSVVVIHQYLREIDVYMIEAARLETNSCIHIIIQCIIPQIKVCLFAVALLVLAEAWNMVEQPMLYLDGDKWRMLSTFIIEKDLYKKEVLLPACVIFMIPVVFAYQIFHDELKNGLKLY